MREAMLEHVVIVFSISLYQLCYSLYSYPLKLRQNTQQFYNILIYTNNIIINPMVLDLFHKRVYILILQIKLQSLAKLQLF